MGTKTILTQIPIFKGLSPKQIETLSNTLVEINFKRDHIIFSEGDEATGFYILISGRIKVFKISLEGKEQILHIFGPGDIFGEVPMFEGNHFPANAETIEKSRLLFFQRSSLIELIKKEPNLAMNMLAALSIRLRQLAHLIEDLSLKEVPGRLAAYLLYLSDRVERNSELKLDIPKGQLASLLGTIPETLSRIFNKTNRKGLIKIKGRKIRLLNKEALKEVAAGGKLLI